MQRFKQWFAVTALATASLCSHAAVTVLPYSAVYVFGDSLSDSGNNATFLAPTANQPVTNTYIPTNPYGAGTYSNSAVWVNAFNAGLGLGASNATPSLLGGNDYAYGGARTATDGAGLTPSVKTQLSGYLATAPAALSSTALYVIAGGGNDERDVALGTVLLATAGASFASSVGAMVDALKARGAAHIIVWDAPDLGKTPFVISSGASPQAASAIGVYFNTALQARLAGVAGVSIFDIYGTVDSIAASPAGYKLTNVVDACGGVAGCDPSKYLFWDGIHPTSAGHALIASSMLALAVPEPASVLLFAAGLGVLVLRRLTA